MYKCMHIHFTGSLKKRPVGRANGRVDRFANEHGEASLPACLQCIRALDGGPFHSAQQTFLRSSTALLLFFGFAFEFFDRRSGDNHDCDVCLVESCDILAVTPSSACGFRLDLDFSAATNTFLHVLQLPGAVLVCFLKR